jgi:TolB protein
MHKYLPILAALCLAGTSAHAQKSASGTATKSSGAAYPTGATPFQSSPLEPRLRNLQQITHGGENAEAYYSSDGTKLIFQATWPGISECDQEYIMNTSGRNVHRVSNGKGRTTCGYFFPGGKRILFASTHRASPDCPPRPDFSKGYVWALYDYDIIVANADGSNPKVLFGKKGSYDAEATISPNGKKIIFTSMRDGDLDLYSMNADGSNVKKLTNELGYDGGAFYSPDNKQIIYRAYHPATAKDSADYTGLLKEGLVRPTTLDLFIMNADGSNKRQITHNHAANFAPYMTSDGKQVIFSSNMDDPKGREFDIYLINVDGTGLERVTHTPQFDGFPMFSPDGKHLVFASNRGGKGPGETDLFIAEWVSNPATTGASH